MQKKTRRKKKSVPSPLSFNKESRELQAPRYVYDDAPSLKKRLAKISQALHLAHAAAQVLASEEPPAQIYRDELIEAMDGILNKAKGQMYWLTLLPEFLQQMPVPDDDQLKEGETRDVMLAAHLDDAIGDAVKAGAR
jgi:hypothetical protein